MEPVQLAWLANVGHDSGVMRQQTQNGDQPFVTGHLAKMPKSRSRTPGKPGENHEFSLFCSSSKPIPKPPENPSDHFEPVSASLDHSQPILHRLYILQLKKKKMLVFLCISYIFIIFSALEAPRPVPNCRSHFSAQTRVIESF